MSFSPNNQSSIVARAGCCRLRPWIAGGSGSTTRRVDPRAELQAETERNAREAREEREAREAEALRAAAAKAAQEEEAAKARADAAAKA